MSKAREVCEDSSPEHAAATWFARRRGGLRADEEIEFARWLQANAAHRAAYDDITQAWAIAGSAASCPQIVQMRSEALMIRRPRERRTGLWAGLAAAVLLMVTGAGNWWLLHSPGPSIGPSASVTPRLFQTAVGERSTVTLDDGSVVTLNTNSKLRVAFTPHHRDVMLLAGQVLFHVAKDKNRPFIVTAGDQQVIAVGTEFEVRLEPKGLRVALLEGRVRIQRIVQARSAGGPAATDIWQVEPGTIAILKPGEQFSAVAGGSLSVQAADVADLVSWREGRVRFDNTPLPEAIAEMNRYSRTPIVIADPQIADLRVSGAFRTGQSSSFVNSITDLFPVRADVTKSTIVLREADRSKKFGND